MSWDRASSSKEIARSLHCDDWESVDRGWKGPSNVELPEDGRARRSSAACESLIRDPARPNGRAGGDPPGSPAVSGSSSDPHRLLPRYRSGDRRVEPGRDRVSIGSTGKSIFNLLEGWVALYILLEDGRRQIVQFALPGAVLGVLPSKRAQATFGAQALTNVVVSVIPDSVLTSHTRADPEIAMRLARTLARDCSMAYDHMTSIGRRSARERIAHLLLELFTRYRAQWPGTRIEEMELPLTQEQIGDATGLTFVHVNRVLSILRKERIVEFHYRRLRIVDPDRLIEVAGVDPQTALAWLQRPSA